MTSDISQRTRWTIGGALALTVAAMARYPGGTGLDATTSRYFLTRNFLSDLGMTVAYNGRPNRLGAAFFVLSLLVLVVGLGHVIVSVARQLGAQPAARRWARSAAAFGFIACVAFTGVAVTPENRVMGLHIAFTQWAWRMTPIISGCLGLASFYTPGLRRAVVALLLVTLLLAGYAALMSWGPSVATDDGLVVQVIAQKTAVTLVLAALLIVSREVDRVASASAPR